MTGEIPKRLVAHPDDVAPADQTAAALGIPVQVTSMVPPGMAFVIDEQRLLDEQREAIDRAFGVLRITGLES